MRAFPFRGSPEALRKLLVTGALATLLCALPTACDPAHRADTDGGDNTGTDATWDGDGMPPGTCDGGMCSGSCGDGTTGGDEACDDGDDDNTDACPTTCEMAYCGDGFVWAGHESCDDGNDVDNDGCTACVLDSCGDAVLDDGEECDLGAANGTHGSSCFTTCVSPAISLAEPVIRPLNAERNRALNVNQLQAADLNADGRMDVVADGLDSGDLTVVFGLGDGRLWAPHARSSSGSIRDLALGDLNGDGHTDAVLISDGQDALDVYLGNGTGFDAKTTIGFETGTGATLSAGAVADISGDGKMDVLVADSQGDRVFVMLGDGQGDVGDATPVSTAVGGTGQGPVDIAIADVTGDGLVDVVTANLATDDVSVLAGLGDGALAGADVYPTRIGAGGDAPVALAAADVNADGRPDVVTANNASDDVTVLAGTAGGTLAAPVRFLTLADERGTAPTDVAVADVTGDGMPDIVTVNDSDDVSVLAKAGAGVAFEAARVFAIGDGLEVGGGPIDVEIVDVDADGKNDVVALASDANDVSVLLGKGDGDFEPLQLFAAGAGYTDRIPMAAQTADINGDGHIDLVVATRAELVTIAGIGDGSFASSQTLDNYDNSGSAITDFEGDGRLDLVTPTSSYLVSYRQGPADGDFVRDFGTSSSDNFYWVAAGDVNGDGISDAVGLSTSSRLRPMFRDENYQLTSFGSYVTLPTTGKQVVLADVTGDGALDLLVPTPSQSAVQISTGAGDGSFGGFSPIETDVSTSGQSPVFLEAVDVTGDGVIDVLTANSASNDVSLLVGQGAGAFDAPIIIPTVIGAEPANVSAVRAGDFNRDGILDVAAANQARGTVSIAIGFGEGAFAAPQVFEVGFEPSAMAVADFDGDGIDDIAVASQDSQLAVLLGRGSETQP